MADFTITVTNAVRCFASPSDKWNQFDWNAFKWGEGTADLQVNIGKLIANSLTPSSSDTRILEIFKTIANILAPTSDPSSEQLSDLAGYKYVFPSNVTNAENRNQTTWNEGTDDTQTWTSGTAGSTTWS